MGVRGPATKVRIPCSPRTPARASIADGRWGIVALSSAVRATGSLRRDRDKNELIDEAQPPTMESDASVRI